LNEPGRGIKAHSTAVIDCRWNDIGADTVIWHFAHVMEGADIGERVMLGQGVHIGPNVHIGDGCRIQNGAQLFEGVVLEDDVFVGPCVVFTNKTLPRVRTRKANAFNQTLVKRGASIGANATILPGVTIGEYAMVGAGAVVTHDVSAYSIVVGNPARHRGWACACGETLAVSNTYERPGVEIITEYQCQRCAARYVPAASDTLKRVEESPSGQSST
jgi:UDP-2-acetamido-3-amino-2,3-dideoxy-glucuronate N-acetyltransferase